MDMDSGGSGLSGKSVAAEPVSLASSAIVFRISSAPERLEELLEAEKRGPPTAACRTHNNARLDCQERKSYLPQI